MITRATLVNPSLLTQALKPDSHIGYSVLEKDGEISRLSRKLPGNCGLVTTLGDRLIYTLLPGKGRDFYPEDFGVDFLLENDAPFWAYGDHKHRGACDGCGAVCPQSILTTVGRELVSLQSIGGEQLPGFIRTLAYRDLGIALVAKQIRNATGLR